MGSSAANSPASSPASSPQHLRASDAERDEAVDHLREQFAAGRLSHDTFLHRMGSALSARARSDLPPLLADLPPARRPAWRQALERLQAAVSDLRRVRPPAFRRTAVDDDWAPLFFPPNSSRTVFTIGREPGCDLLVEDTTVSRAHARLTRMPDGWLLADLGSTNGTTVNGWRVREPVAVRVGDRVRFGTADFVVCNTQEDGDPVAPGT
jgi:pSer/pThr/pTyr-binding forkhead associated (FHA) protein